MKNKNYKLFFKCAIYYIAKYLGLFKLAVKLTANNSRILCYHGGSIDDEHLFWPGVFISKCKLKKHLQLIKKYHFNVIPLDEMINNLSQHCIMKKSLALTFDDGFYSTKLLEPILKDAAFSATLYVTSYFVTHQRPIFNVTLYYLFFKTKIKKFTIALDKKITQDFAVKGINAQRSIQTINQYACTLNEEKQNQLLRQISAKLNVDIDSIWQRRLFHNLTPEELKTLYQNKVFDIQLHTHRHNLPSNDKEFISEIQKNRQILSEITGQEPSMLRHFCYPSGQWDKEYFNWLRSLAIISATTLDPGINNFDTDLLALKRILCADNQPTIVFEGNLSGFTDFFIKGAIKLIHSLRPAKEY